MQITLSSRALYSTQVQNGAADRITERLRDPNPQFWETAGKRMREIDPEGIQAIRLFNSFRKKVHNDGQRNTL